MYLTFEQRLRQALGGTDVQIINMLDTFFAINSNELGYFSQKNVERLYLMLKSAELSGADIIVVICSTLSPHVQKMAFMFPVPIVVIDGRLGEAALKHGSEFTILASAPSAVEPTRNVIMQAAKTFGKEVNIESHSDIRALHAMMSDDMKKHDSIILNLLNSVGHADALILAQGSMEHLGSEISKKTGLPVVSAPSLCIQEIKELIVSNIHNNA